MQATQRGWRDAGVGDDGKTGAHTGPCAANHGGESERSAKACP